MRQNGARTERRSLDEGVRILPQLRTHLDERREEEAALGTPRHDEIPHDLRKDCHLAREEVGVALHGRPLWSHLFDSSLLTRLKHLVKRWGLRARSPEVLEALCNYAP